MDGSWAFFEAAKHIIPANTLAAKWHHIDRGHYDLQRRSWKAAEIPVLKEQW